MAAFMLRVGCSVGPHFTKENIMKLKRVKTPDVIQERYGLRPAEGMTPMMALSDEPREVYRDSYYKGPNTKGHRNSPIDARLEAFYKGNIY